MAEENGHKARITVKISDSQNDGQNVRQEEMANGLFRPSGLVNDNVKREGLVVIVFIGNVLNYAKVSCLVLTVRSIITVRKEEN